MAPKIFARLGEYWKNRSQNFDRSGLLLRLRGITLQTLFQKKRLFISHLTLDNDYLLAIRIALIEPARAVILEVCGGLVRPAAGSAAFNWEDATWTV
jgi:hypothetical protein